MMTSPPPTLTMLKRQSPWRICQKDQGHALQPLLLSGVGAGSNKALWKKETNPVLMSNVFLKSPEQSSTAWLMNSPLVTAIYIHTVASAREYSFPPSRAKSTFSDQWQGLTYFSGTQARANICDHSVNYGQNANISTLMSCNQITGCHTLQALFVPCSCCSWASM